MSLIFCTDLDNTLIYSYRHDIGREKILVERMEGKELSYMTQKSLELLQKISAECMVIPVTTRSLAQYSRVLLGNSVPITYALAANGGILLENGEPVKEWFEETLKIVEEADEELEKAIFFLNQDPDVCMEVRKVDGLFVYTKSTDSQASIDRLREKLDEEKVYLDTNRAKLYVFPKKLDKGSSILRLREWLFKKGEKRQILAAGDSKFDRPMLLAADRGFCPDTLVIENRGHITEFPKSEFTQKTLEEVWRLVCKEKAGLCSTASADGNRR